MSGSGNGAKVKNMVKSIAYQRSVNRSYMIMNLDDNITDDDSVEMELLRQTSCRDLLSFYIVEMEDGLQIWYDITGLYSVKEIRRSETIHMSVQDIMAGLKDALQELSEDYTIQSSRISITPDTVFFDKSGNIRLAYVPTKMEDTSGDKKAFEEYLDGTLESRSASDKSGVVAAVAEIMAKKVIDALHYEHSVRFKDVAKEEIISYINMNDMKEADVFNPGIYENAVKEKIDTFQWQREADHLMETAKNAGKQTGRQFDVEIATRDPKSREQKFNLMVNGLVFLEKATAYETRVMICNLANVIRS